MSRMHMLLFAVLLAGMAFGSHPVPLDAPLVLLPHNERLFSAERYMDFLPLRSIGDSQNVTGSLSIGQVSQLMFFATDSATVRLQLDTTGGYAVMLFATDRPATFSHHTSANYSLLHSQTLFVDIAANSKWYVTIYARSALQYTLSQAKVVGCQRLNDCNGHGECSRTATNQELCSCTAGWTGLACNVPVFELQLRQPLTRRVSAHTAEVYHLNWPSPDGRFILEINTSSSATAMSGPSVWASYNDTPLNPSAIFAHNFTHKDHVSVYVEDPHVGDYYLWAYYFVDAVASIGYEDTGLYDCNQLCSGASHGSCVRDSRGEMSCSCNAGYTGENCEKATQPLTLGQARDGMTVHGLVNYYEVDGAADGTQITIELNDVGQTGNCQIYTREGAYPPTFFVYDQHASGSNQLTLSHELDTGDRLQIAVTGTSRNCTYTLLVSTEADCSEGGGCQNGGTCGAGGLCDCPSNYAGDHCETPVTLIASNTPVNDVVSAMQWKYYAINTSTTLLVSYLTTQASTENDPTSGALWLFIQADAPPTLTSYLMDDKSMATPYRKLIVPTQLDAGEYAMFYIGVYGSPFMQDPTANFKLSVWASPINH